MSQNFDIILLWLSRCNHNECIKINWFLRLNIIYLKLQSEYFSPWHVCKGYCGGGTVFEDGACVPKADPSNPDSCLPAYSPEFVCPSEGKHANPREFYSINTMQHASTISLSMVYVGHVGYKNWRTLWCFLLSVCSKFEISEFPWCPLWTILSQLWYCILRILNQHCIVYLLLQEPWDLLLLPGVSWRNRFPGALDVSRLPRGHVFRVEFKI